MKGAASRGGRVAHFAVDCAPLVCVTIALEYCILRIRGFFLGVLA